MTQFTVTASCRIQ